MEQIKKRSWKNFALEDFHKYYIKNYNGMYSGEVQKKDFGFYYVVWKKGFLKEIFKKRKRKSYENWTKKDFMKYYKENHNGERRGKIEKIDLGFYAALRNRHFLDLIPTINRRIWKNLTLQDFQKYYNVRHKGKSPSEVAEDDSTFYTTLSHRGFLSNIKMNRKKKNWKNFTLEDFQNYYKKNFKGMYSTEVYRKDPGFYDAVWRREFCDEVFPKKRSGRLKKSLEKII